MKTIILSFSFLLLFSINCYAKWIYSKDVDEVTSEASYTWTTNEITNSKNSQLAVGKSSSTNYIGIFIGNNRIIDTNNGDRVDIIVRFDNNEPITYDNVVVGNRYRIAFIWDEVKVKDFLDRIAVSKEVKIRIPIYRNGYAIEKFNVSGLNFKDVNRILWNK